jgi:hypothetical protein
VQPNAQITVVAMMTTDDVNDLPSAIKLLSSGLVLADDLIRHVIALVDRILRDEESEFDWDDAWDILELFGPNHQNALLPLCEMINDRGKYTYLDHDARIWAIRALSAIGSDISQAIPYLLELRKDSDRELRKEATKTLRKLGYNQRFKRN